MAKVLTSVEDRPSRQQVVESFYLRDDSYQVHNIDFESPFAALDKLYTEILAQIPARRRLLSILTAVVADFEFDPSVPSIEQLLELKPSFSAAWSPLRHQGPDRRLSRSRSSDVAVTCAAHHASYLDFLRTDAVGRILHWLFRPSRKLGPLCPKGIFIL